MDDYPARGDGVRPPDERPATMHYTMMLPTSRAERLGFIVRAALAVAAVFVGLFIIWKIYEALLLVLLAIVFASVLMAAAEPVQRWTNLSHRWALAVVAIVLAAAAVGIGWLMGSQISGQVATLVEQVPEAIDSIEHKFGIRLAGIVPGGQNGHSGALVGSLFTLGQTLLGVLAGLILAVVAALYMAADPERYLTGTVKLFPKPHQAQMEDALRASGHALKLWLLG
jgi:predicted PurR-regulated permease PerM